MTTYIVYVGTTLDDIFETFEDAENRVAKIMSKYPFVNPDIIHIAMGWKEG